MAYSRVVYEADGSNTDFTFGFSYLDRSHIKVTVNGSVVSNWVFLTANSIRFTPAPTGIVTIARSTSPNARLVDYEAPSSLNESDLDTDSLQAFFLAQEGLDVAEIVNETLSRSTYVSMCRADFASRIVPTDTITLNGFYVPGDLGSGAVYKRGTSGGPMAIQDAAGNWWNLVTNRAIRAGWCGVKADGVTDDTAAFRLAWNIACASSKTLLLEAGVMLIASATETFTVVSNLSVFGVGHGQSVIKWIEGTLPILIGRRWDAPGRVSNVLLQDFAIIGTHGDGGVYTTGSYYPILSYGVDGLVHRRIRVEKTRVMAIAARGCTDVSALSCVVRYCARDGINFADCDDYDISHNLIEFADDDAIAAHTDYAGRVDRRGVIAHNRIRFSQGIKALGAVTLTITGNTLEFCMGQGICFNTVNYGTEGINSVIGVTVTGNTIKNCIDRLVVDGLNTGAYYIVLSGTSAQAGGLPAIPGENSTSTATVISPYPYFRGNDDGVTTDPVPGAYAITVAGNTCVRDIPSGILLSSLGLGTFYTRNGPVDPMITEASIRQSGVFVSGRVKGLNINGNTFSGVGFSVFFADDARIKCDIRNNTSFDVLGAIVFGGGNTFHHSIISQGNTWDIDSLVSHSGRGANGTWTSAGAGLTAIIMQNAYGVVSRGDTFRNCARVADDALGAAAGTSVRLVLENALLECQPASTSFSTSNKGIGECPRGGPSCWYSIVDSDPGSANYGNRLNNCARQAASIPTSGYYVFGMFVANTGPIISAGKVLLGWLRLTNGSGHVSGTDWAPVYGTTS